MENILQSGFAELGLDTDPAALNRFRKFCGFLSERNAVMNLTAIVGEENIARGHFLDCCALLGLANFKSKRVIDVGTGAGFPGLPLKIAEPSINLTLLDSLQKRVDFLRDSAELLELQDIDFLACRAEDAPAELRESFDIAVSRAVARLSTLCELCLPLVQVGGVFIAMKGPESATEAEEAESAIEILGGKLEDIRPYHVPGTDLNHSAVIIRKVAECPAKYPRRWARITKQPL